MAAILTMVLLQFAHLIWPGFNSIQRLEWMSYDWRMRRAFESSPPVSEKLALVFISDDAIALFAEGRLGTNFHFGLKWPRYVYGTVISELKAEGARAVGMDILFGELRKDHPAFVLPNGDKIESDRFFRNEIMEAGNVFLGATREVVPVRSFRLAAQGIGDISIDPDSDGILRRAKAFQDFRIWDEEIFAEARLNNWDLSNAKVETNQIVFRGPHGKRMTLAITEENYFDPTELAPTKKRGGIIRLKPAYEDVRVWHLGIALAARALNLDLEQAQINLKAGEIIFPSTNGSRRIMPVDAQGRFLIDWSVCQTDPRLTKEAFESLVAKNKEREGGTKFEDRFRDKVVVIGSVASGNELSDRGATPLEKDAFLTLNNLNIVNSMLSGRFVRESSMPVALLLTLVLGLGASSITMRLRVVPAVCAIALVCLAYTWVAVWLFVHERLAIPMVTPLGALLFTHFALVSFEAFFEQSEKRRIRGVFARIVSPDVVQELLKAPNLSLVGARRHLTILFTDVRGFTEMTDMMQARAEQFIEEHQLSPAEAQACSDAQAQEVMETVNQYLGVIADVVKKHEGTLDKYIGDCVMAFWGAPAPHLQHALACVRAAIDAQRAVDALNHSRIAENQFRELQNRERLLRGETALPMLRLLQLGTGINTGVVTVGLMGSESHIQNYTVFGREVNLAARLEPLSGRGRILIGESTYQELLRDDPFLAGLCIPWEPTRLKGFQLPVHLYEVPWQPESVLQQVPFVSDSEAARRAAA